MYSTYQRNFHEFLIIQTTLYCNHFSEIEAKKKEALRSLLHTSCQGGEGIDATLWEYILMVLLEFCTVHCV